MAAAQGWEHRNQAPSGCTMGIIVPAVLHQVSAQSWEPRGELLMEGPHVPAPSVMLWGDGGPPASCHLCPKPGLNVLPHLCKPLPLTWQTLCGARKTRKRQPGAGVGPAIELCNKAEIRQIPPCSARYQPHILCLPLLHLQWCQGNARARDQLHCSLSRLIIGCGLDHAYPFKLLFSKSPRVLSPCCALPSAQQWSPWDRASWHPSVPHPTHPSSEDGLPQPTSNPPKREKRGCKHAASFCGGMLGHRAEERILPSSHPGPPGDWEASWASPVLSAPLLPH